MSAWLHALPALITAAGLVTLLGVPAAWMLRLRGLTFLAASVAASLASIAVASILAPMLGLSWSFVPVLIVAVALAVVLIPVRYLTMEKASTRSASKPQALWVLAALAVAGGLIGVEVVRAIGNPENISQTYDGVFHINAAGLILLTGDASPFHMNLSAPDGTGSFYPTLWHSVVALIAQVSGASVPAATNALAVTTTAWIWPVAILFFSRPFFARRPAHLILGAILAANFTAFPYLLLAWGVLYPNLLSTALIPIALGFLYSALRYRKSLSPAPLASLWIAAAGAIGAASLAHPNAVFGIAAFTVPMFLVVANDVRHSSVSMTRKSLRWGALAAVLLVYIALWALVTTGDNAREYGNSIVSAFVNGVANSPMVDSRAWFLTVLVMAGALVLLLQRRHRWLIFSYGVALGLFVISAGLDGSIRDMFTGAWYNDAHRLAALLPIGAIPLAAIAAAKLFDLVVDGLTHTAAPSISARTRWLLPIFGSVLIFALLLTGARGHGLTLQTGWIRALHTSDGELLSADERALLERLPDEVPEDALIAGDPWTGTGLALAISQREVLFGHLAGTYNNETRELAREFVSLGEDACPLLDDLGVDFLLDFGPNKYSIGDDTRYEPYEGFTGIGDSPVVTEIDREGDAALFRVNCG